MYFGINGIDTTKIDDTPEQVEAFDKLFLQALSDHDFDYPPKVIITDGVIHRFPERTQECWYVAFEDTNGAYGIAGDWSNPDKRFEFSGRETQNLAPWVRMERNRRIEQARKEAEQAREKAQQETADACRKLWDTLSPADPNHPYLVRKGIKPHGIRQTLRDGVSVLVIPLGDHDGIQTLEYIYPDKKPGTGRNKDLESGGRTKGTWFQIGEGSPRFICEGFATACSVFEATGKPVIMAYSAGNLVNVAGVFPQACIVADNDKSQTGWKEAEKASKAHGNAVKLVPIEGMDANDFACAGHDLKALLEETPERPERQNPFKYGDDLLTQRTPQSWLIKGWVPKGAHVASLFGDSGAGKSFVALDMALTIATGQEAWHGIKAKQGTVAYLCGEGQLDFEGRCALWIIQHGGVSLKETVHKHFILKAEPTALDAPAELTQLELDIDGTGVSPDVIVVDTLNRHMQGDENKTQDAGAMIKALDELARKYNACVMYLHHTGKDPAKQDTGRGSSAFRASLDYEFKAQKPREGYVTLKQTKNKGGRIQRALFFELAEYDVPGWFDDDGEPVTSCLLEPCEEPEEQPKTSQQEKDGRLMREAVLSRGYMRDGELYIDTPELVIALYGKLAPETGKNAGEPYKKAGIMRELNTAQQRRFADRLIKAGLLEPVQETMKGNTPETWHILDNHTYLVWNSQHKGEQAEDQTEQPALPE